MSGIPALRVSFCLSRKDHGRCERRSRPARMVFQRRAAFCPELQGKSGQRCRRLGAAFDNPHQILKTFQFSCRDGMRDGQTSKSVVTVIASFVRVAELDQIARGGGIAASVADNVVAVFNVDGTLFALDDACLRCGGSLASGARAGIFAGCSRCDWQYDVATGAVKGVPLLRISRYVVKVVESHVLVSPLAIL